MKKLLLLAVLTAGYSYTVDIPSLSAIKSKDLYYHLYYKNKEGNYLSTKIDEYLGAYPSGDKKALSADEAEGVLTKWYNENPAVFQAKYIIDDNPPQELTLTDLYTIRAKSEKYLPQGHTRSHDPFQRDEEIADILKNLGVPLTISDEQLTALAKMASQEI